MPCCLAHMRVIFTNFTVFIFVTSVVVWLPSGNAIQFVNTHIKYAPVELVNWCGWFLFTMKFSFRITYTILP